MAKRRPVSLQAYYASLQHCLAILDTLSRIAVLTNAMIIAFTSDFIPQMFYLYQHEELHDYVQDSLSYSTAQQYTSSAFGMNVTMCRFRGYRLPPCSLGVVGGCSDGMEHSHKWWVILALRLLFVVLFQVRRGGTNSF